MADEMEQKWNAQYEAFLNAAAQDDFSGKDIAGYISQLEKTGISISKPSYKFYMDFKDRLPVILDTMHAKRTGLKNNIAHLAQKIASYAYAGVTMGSTTDSAKLDPHYKNDIADILMAHANKHVSIKTYGQVEQEDISATADYAAAALTIKYGPEYELKKDNNDYNIAYDFKLPNGQMTELTEGEREYQAKLFLYRNARSETYDYNHISLYLQRPEDKAVVADTVIKNSMRMLRQGETQHVPFHMVTKALELGSSDNHAVAQEIFDRIFYSTTINNDQADRELTFVEKALQEKWLNKGEVLPALNKKMDILSTKNPLELPRSDQGPLINTANATLFYLATHQPESLLKYEDYARKSQKAYPDYGTYTQLFSRLAWLKDGKLPNVNDPYTGRSGPLWGAKRSDDEIRATRSAAAELLARLAPQANETGIPYIQTDNVMDAIALDPQNEKARGLVDQLIGKNPHYAVSILSKLVGQKNITAQDGMDILTQHKRKKIVKTYYKTLSDTLSTPVKTKKPDKAPHV